MRIYAREKIVMEKILDENAQDALVAEREKKQFEKPFKSHKKLKKN